MRYGMNFGAAPLETFPARKRFPLTMKVGTEKYVLVGIATNVKDRDDMLAEASNGRRRVRFTWKRVRGWPGLGIVFAIYVG